MRNLKKVLALVIAFSMMLSVVAFAGYADVDADADYASAVELTSALGIFQGDENGNFNADKTITRAEMAAVIIRMQGLDAAAKASAGATQFADVAADHWASGYVNLASQNGIIKGTGDGNFAPNDTLTYEAAVAMIVRALGFEPVAEQKGGWTAGYVAVANSNKVTEGAAATATRGNLAILVANAMNTPMMDQTSYGSDEKYEVLNGKGDKEYRSLLTDRDIYVVNGIVGAKDADKVAFTICEDSDDKEFKYEYDKENEEITSVKNFEIGESNALAYQDQQVTAYVQKEGRDYVILAVIPSNVGETLTILSDDVVDYKENKVEYYIDAANSNKTKEIKVVAGIEVEFNKEVKLRDLDSVRKLLDVELVFIENTGDTTFDKVIATQYTSDVVVSADADREKLFLKNSTITFDFEDEDDTIILVDDEGNDITLEDFAEGDVVAIVADNNRPAKYENYIQIIKLANASVEGTVDETYESNDVDYVVINGQEYPMGIDETINAGDEGIFYIGLTGKVIFFDGSAAGDNYAYILEGAVASGAFSDDQWQLKLLTEEGVETYDIRKSYYETAKSYIEANFSEIIKGEKFIFENNLGDRLNKGRLVTFKLDGNGEIKEIKKVPAANVSEFKLDEKKGEYREDAQMLGGANLEDDVVIFNVAGKYAKDAYTTDLSYLVDESMYTGLVACNKDSEYEVVVITELQSVFSEEEGFAVVTKLSAGKNEEGEEVTKVTYVQNEEEGVITLDDDSTIKNAKVAVLDKDGKPELDDKGEPKMKDLELAIGDAFMFAADGSGLVSEYVILAKLDDGKKGEKNFVLTADVSTEDGIKAILGSEDTQFVLGYIENEKFASSSKGEKIIVNGETYVVPGLAYKYTYNDAGRNVTIDVADFMADADYAEATYDDNDKLVSTTYSPVLLRLVNNTVVDAYGASSRIVELAK